MNFPGFLLDENVPLILQTQLKRQEPKLEVIAIGEGIAPPKGTLDPAILVWIERHNFILLTNNRSTMPGHLCDHLTQGGHVPGIIQLPKQMYPLREILADLLIVWGASLPGELQDRILYLPLT